MKVRRPAACLLWLALACSALPAPSASAASPDRWVSVSVATLWVRPGIARPVDRPELGNPAHPLAWVRGMTVSQKLWLVGRLQTQALYGTRVLLLNTSGAWSKIAVPGQPTPISRLGYPGWVPSVQLTASAPAAAAQITVVRHPTALLWKTAEQVGTSSGRAMDISCGTRLPVASSTASYIEVVMLNGQHLFMARTAGLLHGTGTPWPALTGKAAVAQAKQFLGLHYLWAGTSGFGFDCSWLMYAVFHQSGVRMPRDADAQYATGVRIGSRSRLRTGDLVFFRNSAGVIHHVGMYVGNGRMIHSPATGLAVQITSIYRAPYYGEFAGGRRFV